MARRKIAYDAQKWRYYMDKKRLAIIFGGQSSEHEVSCKSAVTISNHIDKDKYETVFIGITKDGRWLKAVSVEDIKNGTWRESSVTAVISPDCGQKGMLLIEGAKAELVKIDVAFPALHGLYGEDGTIQGLFELAGIPYVGCGVLASAVSMDKLYTKQIVDRLNIRQAKYVAVYRNELGKMDQCVAAVEEQFSYPVFVKPSNAGSSCGITKAHNRNELEKGLKEASRHDYKILVEETITGRELECAVLGGDEPKASGVGEILAAAEFYDYDAKYNNEASKTVLNPVLPVGVAEKIGEAAVQIFKAVDGYGLARVDFFYDTVKKEVVFNEINTLPGFTSISMYPMLWEEKGMSKAALVDQLIDLAFCRQEEIYVQ